MTMHLPLTAHRRRGGWLALALLAAASSSRLAAQPYFIDSTATALPATFRYMNGMDVEAADIDRDGDLDIIIANEFQPNTLLLNDGRGHFSEAEGRFSSESHDSEDIAVADFDGDGDLDVIFVSEDDFTHEYYLNDGAGRFAEVSDRLPRSIANAVAARDISGDGRPDLFIGNDGQDFLLINDGTGRFIDETAKRLPAERNVTQDIELADIDGDGDLDVMAGNEDGNSVLVNDGTGVFADETPARLPAEFDMETRKVSFADVDRDGDQDVLFSNVAFIPGKDRQDRLYINDGHGVFTDETSSRLPVDKESTIDGKFADIDRDGDLDLVSSNIPARPLKIFANDGAGVFTDVTADALAAPVKGEGLGLELADLNGDSLVDLYVCNRGHHPKLLFHAAAAKSGAAPLETAGEKKAAILPNHPNPFPSRTVIDYYLPRPGAVRIAIYGSLGEEIARLHNGHQDAGTHRVAWSAHGHPPGVYYCRLHVGETTLARAMMVTGL